MATKTKKTPAKKTAKKTEKKTTVKAKVSKKEEKPVVEVWLEESYFRYMSKGPIFISAETHPELEGMTLEEMKEYIQNNKYDMAPIDNEYAEDIVDELKECDIVKDRYLNDEENIFFNN
jgi:hypothetical protein